MQSNTNDANAIGNVQGGISVPVDLNAPGVATAVSKRVLVEIDHYCETAYDDGHRNHLGASLIGDKCSRKLWYVFRWCLKEKFNGRMQRLFNRGHREEDRFVEWLRGIGAKVWTHDESLPKNEKGEYPQFRVSGVNGHFGGSLDAIIELPPRYGILEPILGEFKTNGTGSGFNKLLSDGMMIAKPVHYAQTSLYGMKKGFNWVLYHNINKNDDSLHVELVKLNHNLGRQLEEKAERIITSQTPPARLSDNPTFFECQYCPMKGICHAGDIPEKNCRSCKNAVPVENGEWLCTVFGGLIPKDFIKVGCDNWNPITK